MTPEEVQVSLWSLPREPISHYTSVVTDLSNLTSASSQDGINRPDKPSLLKQLKIRTKYMKQHFQTLDMEQHRQSSLRGEAPLTAWRELLPTQQPREGAQAEPQSPSAEKTDLGVWGCQRGKSLQGRVQRGESYQENTFQGPQIFT